MASYTIMPNDTMVNYTNPFHNPPNLISTADDNNCTAFQGWIYNQLVNNCDLFPASSDLACIIEGEGDVYGLGIRIGLYLQWSSTVLTFMFHPSTFPQLLVTNCIFSMAVAIAYLVIRKEIFEHEVFIVAMLLTMTLMMVPLELMEFFLCYDTFTREENKGKEQEQEDKTPTQPLPHPNRASGEEHRSGSLHSSRSRHSGPPPPPTRGPLAWLKIHLVTIGDVSWVIATTFLLIIVGWQYREGVDIAETCPCCRPKLLGTYYLEQPYVGVLYTGFGLLALVALIAICWFAWLKVMKRKSTGEHLKDPKNWYRRLLASCFFGLVMSFSVAYIETIIYQNQIQDVGSVKDAGQIIPLVMGLSSFSFTLYEVMKECF